MWRRREDPLELRVRAAEERLHVVRAIRMAVEEPQRVLAVMARAPDLDAGRAGLMQEFGVDEIQASAMADVQFRNVTARRRDQLAGEVEDLVAQIAALRDGTVAE